MYGTVARMRLKPGALEEFGRLGAAQASAIPGVVTTYIYQMDADPDELYLATVFESREAYRANAESPEQHARYEELKRLLAGEPEWHDGTIIHPERSEA